MICVLHPRDTAFSTAAVRACFILPTIIFLTFPGKTSSRFGVSSTSPCKPLRIYLSILSGTLSSSLYFPITPKASRKFVLSGTVGPDAITSSLSPITSDSMMVATDAGQAILASCPPFTPEICFLKAFNSFIVAPALSSRSVTYFLSSSVISPAGETSRDDAPPERRHMTSVLASAFLRISIMSFVPLRPGASGSGCDASICLIFLSGFVCPYFTMIIPSSTSSPNISSTACAIGAVALPAPTTISLLKLFVLYVICPFIIISLLRSLMALRTESYESTDFSAASKMLISFSLLFILSYSSYQIDNFPVPSNSAYAIRPYDILKPYFLLITSVFLLNKNRIVHILQKRKIIETVAKTYCHDTLLIPFIIIHEYLNGLPFIIITKDVIKPPLSPV